MAGCFCLAVIGGDAREGRVIVAESLAGNAAAGDPA